MITTGASATRMYRITKRARNWKTKELSTASPIKITKMTMTSDAGIETQVSKRPAVPKTSMVNAFGWNPASPVKLIFKIAIVVALVKRFARSIQ
jgi:hypothetical protein